MLNDSQIHTLIDLCMMGSVDGSLSGKVRVLFQELLIECKKMELAYLEKDLPKIKAAVGLGLQPFCFESKEKISRTNGEFVACGHVSVLGQDDIPETKHDLVLGFPHRCFESKLADGSYVAIGGCGYYCVLGQDYVPGTLRSLEEASKRYGGCITL